MSKKILSIASLLLVLSIALSACGGAATTPPPTVAAATTAVEPTATAAVADVTPTEAAGETPVATTPPTPTLQPTVISTGEGCDAAAPKIIWYVGLGAGGNADVIPKEEAWVNKYNTSQKEACVILQVVHNPESYDTLKAMLAAGTAPDIVGPVGKAGRASFQGAWADITPLADAAGVDLSTYDPALIEFTKDEDVLVGIPFALFPSFIFYNKALFDEASLPYPPHKVGEKYDGKDWTLETMSELAEKLTVDGAGNDATNAAFDPKDIKQFGFIPQWTDSRGVAVLFGGGLPYDAKNNNKAVIPDNWKAAWKWYYEGIWTHHFMPNSDYQNSDLLAKGNPFSSGNIAMGWSHTWYTCCLGKTVDWDIAVMPTVDGTLTAKLHGDTFAIMDQSKNKELAFKVLSQMVVDKDLYQIYGGMPAKPEDRPAFFEALNERFGKTIDWAVAEEMVKHPDIPNHESWLPNLTKANDRFGQFKTLLDQTPDLDLDEAIEKLETDLDAIFQATQ